MIRNFVSLFVLAFGNLVAAQYIPMDPTVVISVNLSSRNHNRIGIVGDRIKKAVFKSSNISVDVEESCGQIFVQTVRPNCPDTTLSIVSSSGCIQELELCFSECSSEIVLLQPILEEEVCDKTSVWVSSCGDIEGSSIADLVEGIIRGLVPEGYMSVDDQDLPFPVRKDLKLQRVSRLVSNEQIVFVYKLHNTSQCNKCVKECQINVLDGDWVFLDRYNLKPNECALVLIGCVR